MQIVLDGERITSREELFESLRRQISSEDFIGNNLDALHDVLTERGEALEVEILNSGALYGHLGEYAQKLMRVFYDCGGIQKYDGEENDR